MQELEIPPAALDDFQSFEILRVWAANNEQCVTINSDLNGNAYDFGYMLAQLAIHGSKLYSEKMKIPEEEAKNDILKSFFEEIENNTGNASGSIKK